MLTANLVGNIGGEPQLKYTPGTDSKEPTPVLTFNVAHNFNVRQGGEWVQRVEWVRVVVFGERGQQLADLLTKGMRIYVFGRLQARPWVGRDDEINAGLEIIAQDVEFAGPRQDDSVYREGKAPGKPAGQRRAQNGAGQATSRAHQDADLENLPF